MTGGRAAVWAVVDASDAVLGSVSLFDLDRAYPRLHCEVAPQARGRHIAVTASRAACRWAFGRGAPKILGLAEVGDEASWRVAHHVGFVYEGRRPAEIPCANGTSADAWAGSLLPAALDHGPAPWPYDPDTALRDGDVVLRRWVQQDAADWARLRSEPSVAVWGASASTKTMAAARQAIAGEFTEDWLLGLGARLAVTVDGTTVGGVSLHTPHRGSRTGEVSWWLAATARGQGIGSRSVGMLVSWALGPAGLHRVEARVHVDNAPSRALAERVGFVAEGVLHHEAPSATGVGNAVLYGLLGAWA
jgi:ribosomal-protein-alanine N-acetyltransferase